MLQIIYNILDAQFNYCHTEQTMMYNMLNTMRDIDIHTKNRLDLIFDSTVLTPLMQATIYIRDKGDNPVNTTQMMWFTELLLNVKVSLDRFKGMIYTLPPPSEVQPAATTPLPPALVPAPPPPEVQPPP